MSLLGRLFGSEKERLPLDPSSPGWELMQRHHDVVVNFASKIHDRVEVVPGERVLYAFIGRPPDAFGIAWFEGGEEHNLKSLMKARGLTQAQVTKVSDELRAAYVRSQGEPRYEFLAGKKHVLVTPSTSLERDIAAIIHAAGAD